MPTLHALLVGINQYPLPQHVLRGCVPDMRHIHEYLQGYSERMGYDYRPLLLTDEQATRQALIDAFGHFSAAERDDCCLFHFSGHGARSDAPEAFRHSEPDGKLDSLVCHDSRLPGGHDLMDKELSYLIWRASQNTERPFVSIIDSCHSGDMRNAGEIAHDLALEVVGVRGLRQVGQALLPEQFEGIEHFSRSAAGELRPPLGRRVHLAAARDVEYAKEVVAGGEPRGIFTWCLLEVLNNAGPLLPYADLLQRVHLRIRNNVRDQSAQLRATFPEDRNRGFLFSPTQSERPSYLVGWDKDLARWTLNAGALHGIPEGDAGSRTLFELADDQRLIRVEKVLPTRSEVGGMDGCDPKRAYVATLKRRAVPKLQLAFAAGSAPEGTTLLRQMMESERPDLFTCCDTAEQADFLLHATGGDYFLSTRHDDRPLFQREKGHTEASARAFLRKLDHVAAWQQALRLHNPQSGIGAAEIDIHLYRLTESRAMEGMDNDVPVEAADWQSGACVFDYFPDGNLPAFQLKIRNKGVRPLWVGLLYLDAQFGIMNTLLPKAALGPGEETWAEDVVDDYAYRTIPLRIENADHDVAEEYLKVLISTEEIDTDLYNQPPLDADSGPEDTTRGPILRHQRKQPEAKDWTAKTICVRIERK